MPPLQPALTDLGKLPNTPYFDVHVWVDYIELLCLVNLDRQMSKADVLDRVRIRAQDLPEGIDTEEEIDPDDAFLEDEDEEEDISAASPAEINDKWSTLASDWYRHLSYRAGVFGKSYPFVMSDMGDVLKAKRVINPEAKLYIFLLLASNLRYFSKKDSSPLTRSFELLSAQALKSFFSDMAEVHVFGTSAKAGGRYGGTLWQKVNKLAADLGEKVVADKDNFPDEDTGDNGLDIVAWVPLGDNNSHRLIVLGQCACTLKWGPKQSSSSTDMWRQTMTLGAGTGNIIFIPFCLRRADGTWHRKTDIQSILIDRLRFTHLLQSKVTLLEKQSAYQVVERALAQREQPV